MNDQIDTEDYVLVPKRKAKLSRARKSVIGFMVLGAVAAIGGGGTFASFSASTTNDAAFSTARLALENGGDSGCITPAGQVGTGITSNGIDSNEVTSNAVATDAGASDCPTLFDTPLKPGVEDTATVEVQNVGDVSSVLYLFAEGACTVGAANSSFNRGTATDLCGRIDMSIFDGTNCVFPAGAGACAALGQSSAGQSFDDFDARTFSTKLTADGDFTVNETRNFTVKVRMKKSTGTGTGAGQCGTGITDGNTDGFDDGDGQGCDNKYQNQKADLKLRWQVQSA